MNKSDERIIQKAISFCSNEQPEKQKQRVVAFVTDARGNVISIGVNSYQKTHPVQAKYARVTSNEKHEYLHAEIAALVKVKSANAKKIFVARVYRDGSLANAKPCPICSAAIKESGIKEIIYTANDKIEKKKIG